MGKGILKIILTLIVGSLLLTMITVPVCAVDVMRVSATRIDPNQSDEQIVALILKENKGIVGFKLHFEYDTNEVEIISSSAGSVTQNGSFSDTIGQKSGQFDVTWKSISAVAGDGSIALLKLKVISGKPIIRVSYSKQDTCGITSDGKICDIELVCSDITSVGISEDADETTSSALTTKSGKAKKLSEKAKQVANANDSSKADSVKQNVKKKINFNEAAEEETTAKGTVNSKQNSKVEVVSKGNTSSDKNTVTEQSKANVFPVELIVAVVILIVSIVIAVLRNKKESKQNMV